MLPPQTQVKYGYSLMCVHVYVNELVLSKYAAILVVSTGGRNMIYRIYAMLLVACMYHFGNSLLH